MRIFTGGKLVVCAALICGGLSAGVAAGQASGQSGSGPGAAERRTPQPYTAEFKITTEQTLANGTTITRETKEMDVLDSQGRRLTVTTTAATEDRPERSFYHVYDPVARNNINWTAPGERATVSPMPPIPKTGQSGQTCWSTSPSASASTGSGSSTVMPHPGPPGGPYGVASPAPQVETARADPPTVVREDLGMQTFEGVQAKGTRTTRTTPAGAIGNDQPLVRTTETWRALSLGLIVHEVTDDPQTGKRTKELTQFSSREPYAGSFQPPEGYEIVTQEMHEVPCGH